MADIGETIALIKSISGQSVNELKSAFDALGLSVVNGEICITVEEEDEEVTA